MAYVEISLLTSFKFLITSDIVHHFYVVSSLPFCNYLDTGMVLIRKMIQSIVDSFPELPCCCCLSVCLGAGSLQVLELTPASPVSTSTRWPRSLRPAVLLNPRVYCTGPVQSHWESPFLGRLIRGPQGESGLILKEEESTNFFPPLHSLGLYNKLSCLRTVSGEKNLLAHPYLKM